MKLLLTSSGITNNAIAQALSDLVGKEPEDTLIAFIPTAALIDRGDKQWLIDDLYRIRQLGYNVDIIELTALTTSEITEALEAADVLFVGGGNTFFLSYWMQRKGLFELLPKLLESKIYAGISAGSMIMGQSLVLSSQAMKAPEAFANEDYDTVGPHGQSSGKTLGLVDFIFRPHLNSRFFPLVNKNELTRRLETIHAPVYALDDSSAIKVVDGAVEVISEGDWALLNA